MWALHIDGPSKRADRVIVAADQNKLGRVIMSSTTIGIDIGTTGGGDGAKRHGGSDRQHRVDGGQSTGCRFPPTTSRPSSAWSDSPRRWLRARRARHTLNCACPGYVEHPVARYHDRWRPPMMIEDTPLRPFEQVEEFMGQARKFLEQLA